MSDTATKDNELVVWVGVEEAHLLNRMHGFMRLNEYAHLEGFNRYEYGKVIQGKLTIRYRVSTIIPALMELFK